MPAGRHRRQWRNACRARRRTRAFRACGSAVRSRGTGWEGWAAKGRRVGRNSPVDRMLPEHARSQQASQDADPFPPGMVTCRPYSPIRQLLVPRAPGMRRPAGDQCIPLLESEGQRTAYYVLGQYAY